MEVAGEAYGEALELHLEAEDLWESWHEACMEWYEVYEGEG